MSTRSSLRELEDDFLSAARFTFALSYKRNLVLYNTLRESTTHLKLAHYLESSGTAFFLSRFGNSHERPESLLGVC